MKEISRTRKEIIHASSFFMIYELQFCTSPCQFFFAVCAVHVTILTESLKIQTNKS